jgi:hypothetical protein
MAVQFPGDEHDTELNTLKGESLWTPLGNTAGCAASQTPFVDVMVIAVYAYVELSGIKFWNSPTAVQFPGDAHETE